MPTHPYKVLTTLLAYRIVSVVTGTGYTVEYPDTATAFLVGVTENTVKDTVSAIPVLGPGERAKVYFNDTLASGELVSSNVSGQGVPFVHSAATTTGMTIVTSYIGPLVGESVALTGTIAEVLVAPGFGRGTR